MEAMLRDLDLFLGPLPITACLTLVFTGLVCHFSVGTALHHGSPIAAVQLFVKGLTWRQVVFTPFGPPCVHLGGDFDLTEVL